MLLEQGSIRRQGKIFLAVLRSRFHGKKCWTLGRLLLSLWKARVINKLGYTDAVKWQNKTRVLLLAFRNLLPMIQQWCTQSHYLEIIFWGKLSCNHTITSRHLAFAQRSSMFGFIDSKWGPYNYSSTWGLYPDCRCA